MTKANIIKTVNRENTNKDIKWHVIENSKNLIALGNNYCESARFEIRLNIGEEKSIAVKDINGWQHDVGYLFGGFGEDRKYADFKNEEDGIKMAVEMVVRFFYYYY